MGLKGSSNAVLDASAMNEVIVFANQYKRDVQGDAEQIQAICRTMEDEESLKGGDGENIRANFITISKGCENMVKSMDEITKYLNDVLYKILATKQGKSDMGATEAAAKAAAAAGVNKKE